MRKKLLYTDAESLQNILISKATGGHPDEKEYKEIRDIILKATETKDHAPFFLKSCRDLHQFWNFIQPKFATYKERRSFIYQNFAPLLDQLEFSTSTPSDHTVSQKVDTVNHEFISKEWANALERRTADPEGAITSARTLLETTCKFILDSLKITYTDKDDLPKLYKLVAQNLNLSPSQHSEQAFKEILTGNISIIKGLGTLRNKLGDAHGKGSKHVKPSPRHATFAVNQAGSVSAFLLETFEAKS